MPGHSREGVRRRASSPFSRYLRSRTGSRSSYAGGMYTEPRDLDRAVLAEALKRHWNIGAACLDYLPIGFGSHHWEAVGAEGSRWFVSADDLRAGHHAGQAPDDV